MLLLVLSILFPLALGADFISYSFPDSGAFGTFSEGAGLDADGNVYAVNYFKSGSDVSAASSIIAHVNAGSGIVTEGILLPEGPDHLYNGVDFDRAGNAFVADAQGKKLFKTSKTNIDGRDVLGNPAEVCDLSEAIGTTGISGPNDVVMSYDGRTAYLSGMNYNENLGLLARCDVGSGTVDVLYRGLRTNGIELAQSQDKLYFTEGGPSEEWINVMDLNTQSIEPVYNFTLAELPASSDIDGMRLDVNGMLYVTMGGSAKVAIVDVAGKRIESFVDIPLMSNPTNLAINGQNVYVVGHNQGSVTGMYTFVAKASGTRFMNLRTPENFRNPDVKIASTPDLGYSGKMGATGEPLGMGAAEGPDPAGVMVVAGDMMNTEATPQAGDTPQLGDAAVTPENGEVAAPENPEAVAPENLDAATPDNADAGAIPENADAGTIPENAEAVVPENLDSATPENGDDGAAPQPGEPGASPRPGEAGAAPQPGEAGAAPLPVESGETAGATQKCRHSY